MGFKIRYVVPARDADEALTKVQAYIESVGGMGDLSLVDWSARKVTSVELWDKNLVDFERAR